MKNTLNIWVIGGDLRQSKLARLLLLDGHTVHTYALEQAAETADLCQETLTGVELADCVVLPLPAAGEEAALNAPLSGESHPLMKILDALRPDQILCAGKVDANTLATARERGLRVFDYFAREELAIANAVPTAEGAIQLAMEELPVTIHGTRSLVIGCGRLGRLLAPRLAALGSRVSVSARKWADLAWAEASGFGAEQTGQLDEWLCGYDLIVNTVPALVLGEAQLAALKPEALVIDLASKPGGVDMEAARRLGVRASWALSLPGKVAPVTAAKAIQTTIYNILREQGV